MTGFPSEQDEASETGPWLRLHSDSAVDLSGLFDGSPAVAAVEPAPRRRPHFWPETTPIAGLTPVLPAAETASDPHPKRA